MRILIVSHSPVMYTGMAEVLRNIFCTLLAEFPEEYEIVQVALDSYSAVQEAPWPLVFPRQVQHPDGHFVPSSDDMYGEATTGDVILRFLPDCLFAFHDPQRLGGILDVAHRLNVPVVAYVNIDGFPVPFDLGFLTSAAVLATMTNFSRLHLSKVLPLGTEIEVVYAPADLTRFSPTDPIVRSHMRAEGLPSGFSERDFIIGWVGRNQWRKQLWNVFAVCSLVRKGGYPVCAVCGSVRLASSTGSCRGHEPEWLSAGPIGDIRFWMHLPTGLERGAWDFSVLEKVYDVKFGKDLVFTEGCTDRSHLSPRAMPYLYRMWDAFLCLSGGEGFSLPVWEAMASSLPVIYSDYSGHGELVSLAGGGLPVGGVLQPEPSSGVFRMVADPLQAVEAIRKIYFERSRGEALGRSGREFVAQHAAQSVSSRWRGIFQSAVATRGVTGLRASKPAAQAPL